MNVILATLACILERERTLRAWRVLPMRLIHRPMLSYCIWKAIKGAWASWGKLERLQACPRGQDCLGSARVSRAGDGVLAIVDFQSS